MVLGDRGRPAGLWGDDAPACLRARTTSYITASKGPLSNPTTAAQPWRRELVLMPLPDRLRIYPQVWEADVAMFGDRRPPTSGGAGELVCGAGKQPARRTTIVRLGAQMETLNFTSGTAMKSTVGLKDGLKISWIPGVIVLFGVSAIFQ